MVWEETMVRRCAIGTLVAGLVGTCLLCAAFASPYWLVFPPGHYFLQSHTLHMGLWADRACVQAECGMVPPSELRKATSSSWNLVLGLFCTTISLVFIGASLNVVLLVSPRKVFTVLTAVFWLLSGAVNVASIIVFSMEFSGHADRHSWCYWVVMISAVIYLAVGLTLAVFACCHRWVARPARRPGEDPVTVAPPPVVSYRADPATADGKPYDFTADPDMNPYAAFGGKPYSSDRSNGPQTQTAGV